MKEVHVVPSSFRDAMHHGLPQPEGKILNILLICGEILVAVENVGMRQRKDVMTFCRLTSSSRSLNHSF